MGYKTTCKEMALAGWLSHAIAACNAESRSYASLKRALPRTRTFKAFAAGHPLPVFNKAKSVKATFRYFDALGMHENTVFVDQKGDVVMGFEGRTGDEAFAYREDFPLGSLVFAKSTVEPENPKGDEGTSLGKSSTSSTRAKNRLPRPLGNRNPRAIEQVTRQYERDQAVVDYVLQEAEGVCELCGENAPFIDSSGSPFLEVHHVIMLAEGGQDVVENAIAVCPNCHRRLHYSRDREEVRNRAYAQVVRLIPLNEAGMPN